MFPKTFKNDTKVHITTHQAIAISSSWAPDKITREIVKRGISGFLDPGEGEGTWDRPAYKDKRIAGRPSIQTDASCCAFTQNSGQYYLFPVHKRELDGVGLTGDDLIRYIKTFNDMRVGFKYKYFGEHAVEKNGIHWVDRLKASNLGFSGYPIGRYNAENMFHWIGVPTFPILNKNKKHTGSYEWMGKPYLHWIFIRYLLNNCATTPSTYRSNAHFAYASPAKSYYNLPRLMFYLIDELGLDPFRAMMYAHAGGPWSSGWGMCYSDYGNNSTEWKQYQPDLSISREQFKALWNVRSIQGTMNGTFCSLNNTGTVCVANKWTLEAKHDAELTSQLFYKDQIVEMVQHIDKAYGKRTSIRKKEKHGTETIRKAVSKSKAAAHK